jgi:SAM-dependent methyltransferase
MSRKANFDPLARAYRWLEYLSFGPILEQTRLHYLSRLNRSKRALVLGDGDGRFLARFMAFNKEVRVDAVDSSAAMLSQLENRVGRLGPAASRRLTVHQADALRFVPTVGGYDLVVTHFFLDCFSGCELESLVRSLAPHLEADALWVASDFAVPQSGPASFLARLVVRVLYQAFGLLTGLETRELPQYARILRAAGLRLVETNTRLRGLLISELWQLRPLIAGTVRHQATVADPGDSHSV